MIEYIRGTVADLTPTQAVIEASGVGYALFISLNTYSAVQGKTKPNFMCMNPYAKMPTNFTGLPPRWSAICLCCLFQYRALADR